MDEYRFGGIHKSLVKEGWKFVSTLDLKIGSKDYSCLKLFGGAEKKLQAIRELNAECCAETIRNRRGLDAIRHFQVGPNKNIYFYYGFVERDELLEFDHRPSYKSTA